MQQPRHIRVTIRTTSKEGTITDTPIVFLARSHQPSIEHVLNIPEEYRTREYSLVFRIEYTTITRLRNNTANMKWDTLTNSDDTEMMLEVKKSTGIDESDLIEDEGYVRVVLENVKQDTVTFKVQLAPKKYLREIGRSLHYSRVFFRFTAYLQQRDNVSKLDTNEFVFQTVTRDKNSESYNRQVTAFKDHWGEELIDVPNEDGTDRRKRIISMFYNTQIVTQSKTEDEIFEAVRQVSFQKPPRKVKRKRGQDDFEIDEKEAKYDGPIPLADSNNYSDQLFEFELDKFL